MKLFLKIFGTILLALLIFIAFLPTILSMSYFQPSLISQINSQIPGHIEVKNYSLGWFGGVEVEGFQLKDPEGNLVLEFENFQTDSSLISILLKGKIDKDTEIKSLNLHIIKTPTGKTNLEESLGSEKITNLVTPIFLSDVNLKFSPDTHQTFTVLLTGKTIQDQQKGDFIIDLLFGEDDFHAKVNITNFPTRIIEAFISPNNQELSGALASVFGDYVNLSIQETTGSETPLYEIKAHSKVSLAAKPVTWNLVAAVEIPSDIEDLSTLWMGIKDFNIQCKNIPTVLLDQSTSGKGHFQNSLGEAVSITMKGSGEDPQLVAFTLESEKVLIPDMSVRIKEPIQLDKNMMKQNLSGDILVSKLVFPQESAATTLSNLSIHWNFDGRKNNIQTNLTGNMANGSEITGKIDYKGNNSGIYASLQGSKVPAHLYELLSGTDFFNPLFGESIETHVEIDVANMDGIVNVQLLGQSGKMTLKGNVQKGILTLNEPFYAETHPSQKLAQEYLKKYSPILGELQSGTSNISLQISKEGFSAPIFDFDIAKVKIKEAKVDLGKLTFNNKGDLKKALKFLNAPSTDKVTIWFTPQYFKMDKGSLDLARTDMLLAGNYPLAIWGNIDFPRNYVDATVAISNTALESAFNIKGMAQNSFLQLPLKGKIEKVRIDSGLASTRIAALLAKQQGGPEGLLLGTVLDMAQGGSSDKVPAPTTNPLPWAGQLKASNTASKETKGTPKKQIENTAKEIIKGILIK